MTATIVFALFAFLFIGVLLAMSFVLDRRRVKEVHDYIPERAEGAFDHANPDADVAGAPDPDGDSSDDSLNADAEARRRGEDVPRPEVHRHENGTNHGAA